MTFAGKPRFINMINTEHLPYKQRAFGFNSRPEYNNREHTVTKFCAIL